MVALLLLIILLERKYWLLLVFLIISIFLNYNLGLKIFGLPLTTQKIGMIIVMLFLITHFLAYRKPISQIKNPFTIPVLLLIIFAFLSYLHTNYPQKSLQGIIILFLIFFAIHIIYSLILISNPERIKQVLSYGITLIFIVLLSIAIINFVKEGKVIGRMTGTFTNPNEYGAMVLMILPVIFAEIEYGDPKLVWIGLACGFLALLTVYFTYSRATYLATLVFLAVIFIGNSIIYAENKKFLLNKKVWIGIFLIFLMGFVIYRVIPQEFFERGIERYQSIFADGRLNLDVSSINKRYNAIWVSLKIFRENPLLGIGIKNFEPYTSYLFGPRGALATENTYLRVLSELGLLGFSVFLYIIFRIFNILIENQKKLKIYYLRCLNKYLTYGFITFLFLMFTNDFLADLRTLWFWVIVIVSLTSLDKKLINKEEIEAVCKPLKFNVNLNEEI